jgi:protein TonB
MESMASMQAAFNRLALLLLATAALGGCQSPGRGGGNAVEFGIPPLKPGVYDVKMVDSRPVATKEPPADFPPELLREGVLGKALIVVTVRANGTTTDASIVMADDILFGDSAVSAIGKWQFTPAKLNGAAVDCRITVPFYFSNPWGSSQLDPALSTPPPNFPEGFLHPGADASGSSSQPGPIEHH